MEPSTYSEVVEFALKRAGLFILAVVALTFAVNWLFSLMDDYDQRHNQHNP